MPYMPPPPVPPPPPPEMPEQVPANPLPRWLHITLRRTDNVSQDKHLLKIVYNLLIETSGSDRFSLYIPSGQKKIRIDFPNQTTRDTVHLRQKLTQLLGATAVRDD